MHGFSGTIYLLAEILRNDNKIFITFFDDFDYISRKYIDAFFYSFLNGTFSEIGFAHGISGNIATVAMISKLIPIDYNKLEQCIKADDHMFKESSEHSCLPSWCNGIAGQILARVLDVSYTDLMLAMKRIGHNTGSAVAVVPEMDRNFAYLSSVCLL